MTEADSANSTASILPENKRDGGKLKKNSEIFQTVLSSAVNEKVRIGFDNTTSLLLRAFFSCFVSEVLYAAMSCKITILWDLVNVAET